MRSYYASLELFKAIMAETPEIVLDLEKALSDCKASPEWKAYAARRSERIKAAP